jgi:hypothetical protein
MKLIFVSRAMRHRLVVALCDLEGKDKMPKNYQLLDDDSVWVCNSEKLTK